MMTRSFLALTLLAFGAAGVRAQQPQSVVLVRVVDTTGRPLSNVDVAAIHGLNAVVENGPTDARGLRRLVLPRGDDEVQIVVRRVGYQRADQFLRADRDSLAVVLRLHQTATELAPVQVVADENLNHKRYHIGADEIAESKRPILSGLDVISKLRPDMIDPPGGKGFFTRCGIHNLWINGQRILYPPSDPALAARTSQSIRAARATPHIGVTGLALVPVGIQSALDRIHPEHIEEITYAMCGDTTVDRVRGDNALFVTLKPGVAYDVIKGSYVAESQSYAMALASGDPDAILPHAMPPFRHRVLGIFDIESGDVVPGAKVIDSASGTFALTTATGTVSLAFLPEGTSTLQIHHSGYADTTVVVTISPRDTTPVTLLVGKRR